MKIILAPALTIMLSACAETDHTHIDKAGDGQGDIFLIQMCQQEKNRDLYQCKEICKVYVCE